MQAYAIRLYNMEARKADALSRVSITVDCTVGNSSKGSSSGSGASSSAESAVTTEVRC